MGKSSRNVSCEQSYKYDEKPVKKRAHKYPRGTKVDLDRFPAARARVVVEQLAGSLTGQAEGGDNKQTAINQWEIAIHLEHEGRDEVFGKGGAVLDEKGVATQLAISYALPQGEARLLVSKGRTYKRMIRYPTHLA